VRSEFTPMQWVNGAIVYVAWFGFAPLAGLMLLLIGPPAPSGHSGTIVTALAIFLVLIAGISTRLIFSVYRLMAQARAVDVIFLYFRMVMHAMMAIVTYALSYEYLGVIEGTAKVTRRMDFLYFSIVTWTTLGYGDLRPTLDARMFAASEALYGYFFMGLYVALVFYTLSARTGNPSKEET